jgi:hypothetical protein
VAVQVTRVEPTENSDPDGSQQLVVMGAVPPYAVAPNVTGTDDPFVEVADGEGHVIASGLLLTGSLSAGAMPATSAEGALRVPARS